MPRTAPTIDVHQHLLGEPLVAALAARSTAPMLIRREEGWALQAPPPLITRLEEEWTCRVPSDPDSVLRFEATDADLRVAALAEDGLDRALVALSTALGIESLPPDEAAALIEAHHRGIEDLPAAFAGWGAGPL